MPPAPGLPSEVPAMRPLSVELLGPHLSVYTSPHLYPETMYIHSQIKLVKQKITFNGIHILRVKGKKNNLIIQKNKNRGSCPG
jgi:hypothetical protein